MLEDKLTEKTESSEINFGKKVGTHFLALALGAIANCGTTYSVVSSNRKPECNFSVDCSYDEHCSSGRCVADTYKEPKGGHYVCKDGGK